MAVQIIEAKKEEKNKTFSGKQRKLKVAAYCRVSTDSAEQENSYAVQCSHYTQYILGHPEWEMAGIYADEGISGTSTKNRLQFTQMIKDCENGKIHMILTKSISRFARNTLDCLQYIRKLKEWGIAIYFEKESINTLEAKGEILITIMASIAQQESQSISQNVRMGIQYRMQQGKGRLNTSRFLGLTRGNEPGELVIVPEEAEIVRRIFREFLNGYSPAMIARHLEEDGILTPAGKTTWYPSTVTSILENEKYAGDLMLQKYYTTDFLTHKIVKNTGQLPKYYVKDHHEPIVPRQIFLQVQEERMRRSALKNQPAQFRAGSPDALQGRLLCGICGRTLKRCLKTDGTSADWQCRRRAYQKKSDRRDGKSPCHCPMIPEKVAREIILRAFNHLPQYREQLRRLREQLLYEKIKPFDERIAQSEEERNQWMLQRATRANTEMQLRQLEEFLDSMEEGMKEKKIDENAACIEPEDFFQRTRYPVPEGIFNQSGKMTEFHDDIIIHYLENVTVYEEGSEVHFKGGLSVKIPNLY